MCTRHGGGAARERGWGRGERKRGDREGGRDGVIIGGSTQQGYIPLHCSTPLWSDQEVINPLLASEMLYLQLEEHSNRKEGGMHLRPRVWAMWALVRVPCIAWAQSKDQGSGVAKLLEGFNLPRQPSGGKYLQQYSCQFQLWLLIKDIYPPPFPPWLLLISGSLCKIHMLRLLSYGGTQDLEGL